ncbi:MAG: radical SAM protein [Candidatus Omnitrophota bacterium]
MDHLKKFRQNLAYYFSDKLNRPLAKPLWVYLSLSHKCTYHCQMCGVVNILQGYDLKTDEVKKIFDEISAWQWDLTIVITGGEAFLRKDIFEIIGYGCAKGLKIEIVSNGALITKDLADRIISSSLKNIAVSLDGAKETTHDAIRQKGAFEKAINAIKFLVAAKKAQGRGPQISVWTTIMKENVNELSDIIKIAADLEIDCLVYHPVIVAQDDMQNTDEKAPFWIRGKDLDILKEQTDKILNYQSKNGLVAFLHDPHLWIKYFNGQLNKDDWKCNPFVFMNIGPDGMARSCGAAFGNAKEIGLDKCLVSKEADQARMTMKSCQKPCLQTCWANPESDSLAEIVNSFIKGVKKNNKAEAKNEMLSALSELTKYEELIKECVA